MSTSFYVFGLTQLGFEPVNLRTGSKPPPLEKPKKRVYVPLL